MYLEFLILGSLHTQAKGCVHVITRALDFHPKAAPTNMIYRNLRQTYILEVGLTQISAH